MQVMVSILPQKYFVERIAGPLAEASVMVLPGASPHTYEPKANQMRALAATRIYFAIGVPFERAWLPKITGLYPNLTMVNTDSGIPKRRIESHSHAEKAHGPKGGAHGKENHEVMDPHIWLSPPLVKVQARTMAMAFASADPQNRDRYEANLKVFEGDLDSLDEELRRRFEARDTAKQFLVFHPSWGYFADAYGLEQIPMEIRGKEPSAKELAEIIQHARLHGIRTLFVQPQFNQKSARTVAREIGGQVIVADPLREDWMSNLREVASLFSFSPPNRTQ